MVVGGGVVGLACAAALARAGRPAWVLERGAGLARETTARNSGVVHAGIYYPEGSRKATLCVRGRGMLYARCAREGIPHRRTGKWIVATGPEEVSVLHELRRRGAANGVPGLAVREGARAAAAEPDVRAVAILESPESGIVDAEAFALSFAAEAERFGAEILLRTEVVALEPVATGWRVRTRDPDGGASEIRCGAVVNAAGLGADALAELAGFDLEARGHRLHLCKGDYFALAPGAPLRVSRLVYPVPVAAGLGVHVTLDLGGRIRLGPDTEYVDRVHYTVDPAKAEPFAEAARRYLPALRSEWLSPDTAGVRPKLQGPGEPLRDFVVQEESGAGFPGFVNLIGIESPGLTAAPALAEEVVALLRGL